MKWSLPLCVDAHDTDFAETARPAALLRYMQSAANMQLHTLGPTNEELLSKGQAFVLCKIRIVFQNTVNAYDNIVAHTWSCESKGFSFNRCFSITKGSETVAEAASVWALLDIHSRKPIRVEEFHPNFEDDLPISPDVPLRFQLPTELYEIGIHKVTYSETDRNRHMNNVRYLDMLCNFMDMEDLLWEKASLSFLNEAKTGEILRIYKKTLGDEHFFKSIRQDGKVNIEAYIKTKKRR